MTVRSVTVTLEPERPTPNTWRFVEVVPNDLAAAKVGKLYVPKATLGELGFEEGDNLTVSITVDKNSKALKPKTQRRAATRA